MEFPGKKRRLDPSGTANSTQGGVLTLTTLELLGTQTGPAATPLAAKPKRAKHYGTPGSQVITQPSTDGAHSRLSSQF
jgi:hypothetical protein